MAYAPLRPIRWGILGTGSAANNFAEGLRFLPDAELVAIGSSRRESALAFAERFGIPNVHAGYPALAADPGVEVVYVATLNPAHYEHVRLCLLAGKAVLCEKPFTMNAAQARELSALARERGLFLMEGMWTRLIPAVRELRRLLSGGVIGEPRMLIGDFGARADLATDRLFRPELGGGALLDRGVYLVSLTLMIFGPPRECVSLASRSNSGVDEQAGVILTHDRGELSVLACAIRTATRKEAIVFGSEGWCRIDPPLYRPTRLALGRNGGVQEVIAVPISGNGFNYEAAEVHRCLRAGWLESDVLPLSDTCAVMETLDRIRARWRCGDADSHCVEPRSAIEGAPVGT